MEAPAVAIDADEKTVDPLGPELWDVATSQGAEDEFCGRETDDEGGSNAVGQDNV
jgi:hypothetical protein